MSYRIIIGIPKPETAEETNDQLTSVDGMRRAILRAARDSALIRQCLMTAEHAGLKGEDLYAMMAYHALRQLEDLYQRHSDVLDRLPMPPMILKKNVTETE
jgi:hypothetical protein